MKIKILEDLSFLGENREKKTLLKIREHVETTYQAVAELDGVFEAFGKDNARDYEEKAQKVDQLEKKGDQLRRAIEEDLYSGAFLPISRSRILDFAENTDRIADIAEDAAKLLQFLRKDEMSPALLELLREDARKAADSIKLLIEAVEDIEDLDKVKGIIKRIRAREHESDEITHRTFELLYREDHSARVLHILTKLIEFVSSLSDAAEDASDSLSLIVLMHKV